MKAINPNTVLKEQKRLIFTVICHRFDRGLYNVDMKLVNEVKFCDLNKVVRFFVGL
jgi:hypothetical protein